MPLIDKIRDRLTNVEHVIEVTPEGVIYAFIISRGLVRSREEPLRFTDLDYHGGFLFYLAADPAGTNRFVGNSAAAGFFGRRRIRATADSPPGSKGDEL